MEFYLSDDYGQTWRQVSKEEYVRAERAAGFRNKLRQPKEPATGSWSRGSKAGRTEYI